MRENFKRPEGEVDCDEAVMNFASSQFTSVRILLVDDFKNFRDFVSATLRERPELRIVGEASDGLEAVQKALELRPDLILLDIGLPGMDGLEAAMRIHEAIPGAKIIFVTMNSNAVLVRDALGNGAKGYIVKADAASELLPGIEAVLEGKQFVSSVARIDRSGPPTFNGA